jgi:hypothetical protein
MRPRGPPPAGTVHANLACAMTRSSRAQGRCPDLDAKEQHRGSPLVALETLSYQQPAELPAAKDGKPPNAIVRLIGCGDRRGP